MPRRFFNLGLLQAGRSPEKFIDLTAQISAHWIGRLILTFIDFH
jgi:hypothetical protein